MAELYTLSHSQGLEVAITNYGARIVTLQVPGRGGQRADVVLGFDSLAGYLQNPLPPYFGATIGRYANRIANGEFVLDGKRYVLARNDGPNSLHGGLRGFDKVLWRARVVEGAEPALELEYLSHDGEEGYPGNLSTQVTYAVAQHEVRISYRATTDRDTIVNLTHHSYFNLAGQDHPSILDHVATIQAGAFTPVDANLIPTGEIRAVAQTPFDFRQPHAIGERIHSSDEQLRVAKGYDQNFVLRRSGNGLELAARVSDPVSGRTIEVLTTEPGMQFYTGNHLDGTFRGKGGVVYRQNCSFCLEPQHFPDSPHHPNFPPVILRPNETYRSATVYRFPAVS